MTNSGPATDTALLAQARRLLATSGFRVQEGPIPGTQDSTWVLAESEAFILAVVPASSPDDLAELEAYAATALSEAVSAAEVGAKRWDAYLVLLSSGGENQRGSRTITGIQYNTRSLRRLVQLGVPPEPSAVRRALSTFLPLPDLQAGAPSSALDDLLEQLVVNGADRHAAASSIAEFRATVGGPADTDDPDE